MTDDDSGYGDYFGYVDSDYLDRAAQILAAAKQRTHELMDIREGNRVLDVGCGPGSDTLALGDIVGDEGLVHGVDADRAMIDEANSRSAAAGLGDRVVHRAGDASALPFDDGYFDACRSERVIQHLVDPRTALVEMIRVTRPGGRIVVLDTDYASVSVSTELSEIERRLADQWRAMANSPYAPRLLPRWFNESGVTDVAVEIVPIVMDDLGTFSQTFIFDRAMQAALEAGRITPTRPVASPTTSRRPNASAGSSRRPRCCSSVAAGHDEDRRSHVPLALTRVDRNVVVRSGHRWSESGTAQTSNVATSR